MSTLVDAQRYAKLRKIAEAAKHLGKAVEIDLDDLDASVDQINVGLLPMVNQLNDFAEFVTLVLEESFGGFNDAVGFGGTGIYRDGFYWRCLRSLSQAERRKVRDLLAQMLSWPKYKELATWVGLPHVEEEHAEDCSVVMKWSSEEVAQQFDDIKGPIAGLLFGDLAIMKN
jgi:hypothetical protein